MTKLTDLLMIYYRLTIEGVSDITAKEYFTMTDKEREEYEKTQKKLELLLNLKTTRLHHTTNISVVHSTP